MVYLDRWNNYALIGYIRVYYYSGRFDRVYIVYIENYYHVRSHQ